MPKVSLGYGVWPAMVERKSDGWLIRFFNRGRIPSAIFLQTVEFKLPRGKDFLANGTMVELISEPTANPGGEVTFKLTVKRENISELLGTTLTFSYGTGMGQYYDQTELTLS